MARSIRCIRHSKVIDKIVSAVVCLSWLAASAPATSFELLDASWPEGRTTFFVDFQSSNPTMEPTKFQPAFIEAMSFWNESSTFIFDLDESRAQDPCSEGGNGVAFASTACGDAFGDSTLAIAVTRIEGSIATSTGIVFNDAKAWDVFAGPTALTGPIDFRRVAVHELGHALGLDHSDDGQAIMRPTLGIGGTEVPQPDDIAGVAQLYDADFDGVGLAEDNCRVVSNPDQIDQDNDDEGDACDEDIDGDGIYNGLARDQSFAVEAIATSPFLISSSFSFGITGRALAQTVTSNTVGKLMSVAVPIRCATNAGFDLSITQLDGETPSPTVLAAVSIADASSEDTENEDGFREVDVSQFNIQTEIGQRYAIVVDTSEVCFWRFSDSGSYDRGSARSSSSDRGDWSALTLDGSGVDLPFISRVLPSVLDNCPTQANTNQANFDNDLFGDVCDSDIDNDGALNEFDTNDLNSSICSDDDNDLCDDCSQGTFNILADGQDTDGDGICNMGDLDDDGDGVSDSRDNCSIVPNDDQRDTNGDGVGDVCEESDDTCIPVTAKNGNTALVCI